MREPQVRVAVFSKKPTKAKLQTGNKKVCLYILTDKFTIKTVWNDLIWVQERE